MFALCWLRFWKLELSLVGRNLGVTVFKCLEVGWTSLSRKWKREESGSFPGKWLNTSI